MFAKWKIVIKTLPLVAFLLIAKVIVQYLGWDVLPINPLLTAIIAGNVFVLGFLLTGTLQDYKESERIPGEMSASLNAIYDEIQIIQKNTGAEVTTEAINHLKKTIKLIEGWFYKEVDNLDVFEALAKFNDYFLAFEKLTQANFIVRMKQEQNNLRRLLIRAKNIRDTKFAKSGYVIAELNVFLLAVGMMFLQTESLWESMFFVAVITFLTNYLLAFVKDIDNPFDYKRGKEDADEISLWVITSLEQRISKELI